MCGPYMTHGKGSRNSKYNSDNTMCAVAFKCNQGRDDNKCGPKFGKCNRFKDGKKAYCNDYGMCGPYETHKASKNSKYNSDDTMCAIATQCKKGRADNKCGPLYGHSKCNRGKLGNKLYCNKQGKCGPYFTHGRDRYRRYLSTYDSDNTMCTL